MTHRKDMIPGNPRWWAKTQRKPLLIAVLGQVFNFECASVVHDCEQLFTGDVR